MLNDPLVGQQLGRYRLDRIVGRGGMGQVYAGHEVRTQRPVAVKVIDLRFREDRTYVERFTREAAIAASWHHPNIIQIYFTGNDNGLLYFVMDYVEGQTLSEWMSGIVLAGQRPPQSEVLRIGQALASALDYAHQRGVIHRDVKPGNVLLANDGRVVLTDFGLALSVGQGSLGTVFGSAHYMAPEQARRSADAVPQSDLYALGVILYEMLAGSVPFDDPSPTPVAVQHLTQPPPSPRSLNPALSAETERVLLKALAKEPSARYPTGAALLAALEKSLQPGGQLPDRIELPPPPVTFNPNPKSTITDPLIGMQLGDYRLEALLGRGGMARVYAGLDARLKRRVAIKIIDPLFQNDPDHVQRFEREAQAIAQLEHPHIVRLYQYGETEGRLYLVMQYMEGGDLHDLLAGYRKSGTRLPPAEALRLGCEIALALDFVHSKGIIHRDLTPANVMLDEKRHAMLTDFGLALLVAAGSRGEILGSPHYVAPEQAVSSAKVVPQSDLYSLGVILYEMFTGERPFEAVEPLDVVMQHMSAKPRPPRQVYSEVSPALEKVLLKALAKDPAARYPTGAALAQALTEALAEIPQPSSTQILEQTPNESQQIILAPARDLVALPDRPLGRKTFKPWRRLFTLVSSLLFAGAIVAAWIFLLEPSGSPARLGQYAAALMPGWFPSPTPASTAGQAATCCLSSPTATSAPTLTSTLSPSPSATQTAAPTQTLTDTVIPTLTATSTSTLTSTASLTPDVTSAPTLTLAPQGGLTETPTPTETLTPTATRQPPTATSIIIAVRQIDQMPMVLIPAGTFAMGAANDDPRADFDERPQHPVTLSSFYIDQYEVSVAQYVAFLNFLKKHAPNACLGFTCVRTRTEVLNSHILWDGGALYAAEPSYASYPVNNVSWFGASAYCAWVEAHLPTEAEWEYAARGTDGRLYPWGNTAPEATLAIFSQSLYKSLQPVDALSAGVSFFGVYGMSGGVWEWTADRYGANYYTNSALNDPTGPAGAIRDPRVRRGGSWKSSVAGLRASDRNGADPINFSKFGEDGGFRCVRATP